MRVLNGTVAIVLVAAIGCATSVAFVCPARGGPAWRDVGSDHFVLRTDLEVQEAVEAEQRALEVVPERSSEAVSQALKDRLQQIRVQCRQVPPPPSPPSAG